MCCFGLWCDCDAALLHTRVPWVFSAALGAGRVHVLLGLARGRARAKREVRRHKKRVLVGGIEPTTLGLLDPRSDQLSYTSTLREEVVGRGIARDPTEVRTDDPKGSVWGHRARDVDEWVIDTSSETESTGQEIFFFFLQLNKFAGLAS